MRVECPRCSDLSEALIVEIKEREVRFFCKSCSRHFSHFWINEKIERTASEITGVSNIVLPSCPKCGNRVLQREEACSFCGLTKTLFESFDSTFESRNEEISTAWRYLETDWESDHAHENFLKKIATTRDFRNGAAKYRQAADDVEREKRCIYMLASIQKLATATLIPESPTLVDEKQTYGRVFMVLVVCFLLTTIGALYAMSRTTSMGNAADFVGGSRQGKRMATPVDEASVGANSATVTAEISSYLDE